MTRWRDIALPCSLAVTATAAYARMHTAGRFPFAPAGGAAEVVVLGCLAARVCNGAAELRQSDGDLLLRIHSLRDRLLRVAGLEAAVVYYAFAPRRARPAEAVEFAYTDSGLGGILGGIALAATVEGLVIDLLVRSSHPRIGWGLLALNVYTLVWLLALFRASIARPVLLAEDHLLVRTSLLATARVPLSTITAARPLAPGDPAARRSPTTLCAAVGASPSLLLTLSEPVVAVGILGIEREVDRIALYVDDVTNLLSTLEHQHGIGREAPLT